MRNTSKSAVRNLVLLVVVALPLAMLAVWAQTLIFPPDWMQGSEGGASAGDYLAGFLFWMLILVVPVFLGGCLHQAILYSFPTSWTATRQRLGIICTSPVILVGFLAIGNAHQAFLLPRMFLPVAVALLSYGFLARPLRVSNGR